MQRYIFSITSQQLSFIKNESKLRCISNAEFLRRLIDEAIEHQATSSLKDWERVAGERGREAPVDSVQGPRPNAKR